MNISQEVIDLLATGSKSPLEIESMLNIDTTLRREIMADLIHQKIVKSFTGYGRDLKRYKLTAKYKKSIV